MRKLIAIAICDLIFTSACAQKPGEAEARAFLEKTWSYLKASDSIAFVSLWSPEDSIWQKQYTPAGFNYMDSYYRLKKFLAPAIAANLNIDYITIGEENTRGTQVTAMLKPKENAFLGFTFYISNVNGKWIPRGKPNYLAKSR